MTATTYPLSLHDALPICPSAFRGWRRQERHQLGGVQKMTTPLIPQRVPPDQVDRAVPALEKIGVDFQLLQCFRSEEHTSELQSRGQLVCRLLLGKKYIQE